MIFFVLNYKMVMKKFIYFSLNFLIFFIVIIYRVFFLRILILSFKYECLNWKKKNEKVNDYYLEMVK